MLEWFIARLPRLDTSPGRALVAVIGATVVVLTGAGVYLKRKRRKPQGSVETVDDFHLPNTVVLTPYSRTIDTPLHGSLRSNHPRWPPAAEISSTDDLCQAGLQALQMAMQYWQTAVVRLGQERLNGNLRHGNSTSGSVSLSCHGNHSMSSDGTTMSESGGPSLLSMQDPGVVLRHLQQMVENTRRMEEDFQHRFLLDADLPDGLAASSVSTGALTKENLAKATLSGPAYSAAISLELPKRADVPDEDSDSDSSILSFVSATMELSDEGHQDLTSSPQEEVLDRRGNISLYQSAVKLVKKGLVPCRTLRTEMLHCITDSDFLAKLHCVRRAFDLLFENVTTRDWLVSAGNRLMSAFLRVAGKDPKDFADNYTVMSEFVSRTPKQEMFEELKERQVVCFSFYDVVLDFALMDAFIDLDNPPSTITSILSNGWLTRSFKETALSTAVWSVLKAKRSMLSSPNGFLGHFYNVMTTLSPVLAWGFLGPDEDLRAQCYLFKDEVMGLIRDMFSFKAVRYSTLEALSEDVFRLTKQRHDDLLEHFQKVQQS